MRFIAIIINFAAGLFVVAIKAGPSLAAITQPVRIDTGLVAGVAGADPTITAFKGLPYAAPPIGDLRWRPPAPAASWQGVRQADHNGDVCPEGRGKPGQTMSEDCLNLNVWTGAKGAGEKRAVMVWFHGAGDNAADALFDGENLAKKGVVVVTVNYRVGALGQLATPELSAESGHDASGNYGLMDDIAALKWVQRNIAAFGGDPNNVTLFGQSYGAGTQHFLAMSPLAKGLFGKMITQSHARYPRDPVLFQVATSYTAKAKAEADGAAYVARLGVHSLAELRQVPVDKLLSTPGGGGGDHVLDGYVLPHDYADTYAAGTQANVLVIAGNNKDESGASPETNFERAASRGGRGPGGPSGGSPGGPPQGAPVPGAQGGPATGQNGPGAVPSTITKLSDYLAAAHAKYGAMADAYLKLYPASTDHEAYTANNEATRDTARVSLWMWAGAWREKATKPVYLYFWTHAPPGAGHDSAGAYHGSEIAYVYDHAKLPGEPWAADDERIGDIMSSYWSNYAKTGDPNGPGLPHWSAYDGKTPQVMELGDHFQAIPLADPAKVDFWKRYYQTQPAG